MKPRRVNVQRMRRHRTRCSTCAALHRRQRVTVPGSVACALVGVELMSHVIRDHQPSVSDFIARAEA